MSKMKKVYRKVMNRWIVFGATSLNYEKYEGLGYTYAMLDRKSTRLNSSHRH